jgi:ArsR family transcriptional regulator
MIAPQEFFTVLSDETRLRCLLLLHREREICVCEFSRILDSIQPKVSRHLSLLRRAGIVSDERRGQWVYYRLNESSELWVKELLNTILKNLGNQEPYLSDFKKLTSIRGLKVGLCKQPHIMGQVEDDS